MNEKNPYGSLCVVSGESVSHLARRSASGPSRTPSRAASRGRARSPSSRVSPVRARACSPSTARRSSAWRWACWRSCDSLASALCNFAQSRHAWKQVPGFNLQRVRSRCAQYYMQSNFGARDTRIKGIFTERELSRMRLFVQLLLTQLSNFTRK